MGPLALFIIAIILQIIVPLPPLAIDFLVTCSLVVSLMTLFISVSVKSALEFTVFPSFLLLLTFFRLGLNIATTRSILTNGESGAIIHSFGTFVTHDSLFMGALIFLLIATINFIVITKGAGRIAEVHARFMLEALPGRQMAIDADLNAKRIGFREAKKKREQVLTQAEFYGAMDGASKFIRGEALASFIITSLNLAGGLFAGFSSGMDWQESLCFFAILTIGDGLATQIPTLLLSLSSGILITKVSSVSVQTALFHEFFKKREIYGPVGIFLCTLCLIPGMPKLLLLLIGSVCLYGYFKKNKKEAFLTLGLEKNQEDIKEQIEKRLGFCPSLNVEKVEEGCFIKVRSHMLFESKTRTNIIDVLFKHASLLMNFEVVAILIEKQQAIMDDIEETWLLKILQDLLKEGVMLHDVEAIFSLISEWKQESAATIVEKIRSHFKHHIMQWHFPSAKTLHAITFDPEVERNFILAEVRPKVALNLEKRAKEWLKKAEKLEIMPLILTESAHRKAIAALLEKQKLSIPVFSLDEISEKIEIRQFDFVNDEILI